MRKVLYRHFICLLVISLLVLTTTPVSGAMVNRTGPPLGNNHMLNTLADSVEVTVTIQKIRALYDMGAFRNPNFFVEVTINKETFTSPIWRNTKYVYDPQWSASATVPLDSNWVFIQIKLYDKQGGINRLCDISPNNQQDSLKNDSSAEIWYDPYTGHWVGDDWAFYWGYRGGDEIQYFTFIDPAFFDPSGYGRLNGCDDGTTTSAQRKRDRDCELWFDITQTDPDGDGIPDWMELYIYGTDPMVDNRGEDADNDGIPIEWEWRWGYDPFTYDNHLQIDLDRDGLDNYEEFLTSQWGSDPFRKDLFIELDQMEGGPNGEPASLMPEGAKELLRTAYNKQNIVYHLDDGSWEHGSGSEMIPFDNLTEMSWGQGGGGAPNELNQIYNDYFLHGDEQHWRRGVFHYGVLIYQCSVANGNAFGNNRFQISSKGLEEKAKTSILRLYNPFNVRDVVYASAYMHETGHTLGLTFQGVDAQQGKFPWQKDFWKFLPYKSVMNYGWMYKMVDYSDGSRGRNDFDDWSNLDLEYFQRRMPWH